MLSKFEPIRALEYRGPIWRNFGRGKPSSCPECRAKNTWEYIGFAPNYTDGSQAKLYRCSGCEAWVDCVWPKWEHRHNNRIPVVASTSA